MYILRDSILIGAACTGFVTAHSTLVKESMTRRHTTNKTWRHRGKSEMTIWQACMKTRLFASLGDQVKLVRTRADTRQRWKGFWWSLAFGPICLLHVFDANMQRDVLLREYDNAYLSTTRRWSDKYSSMCSGGSAQYMFGWLYASLCCVYWISVDVHRNVSVVRGVVVLCWCGIVVCYCIVDCGV